jgi:hypothetical protein
MKDQKLLDEAVFDNSRIADWIMSFSEFCCSFHGQQKHFPALSVSGGFRLRWLSQVA